MAILDALPGVEVTVLVSNRQAVEYDADDEQQQSLAKHACPTSTKFIESIDDATFSIKLVPGRSYSQGYKKHALWFRVYIDGQHIESRVLKAKQRDTIDSKTVYDRESRQWKNHQLKFSAIRIVDDSPEEQLVEDLQSIKELGLITVTVERRIIVRRCDPTKNVFNGAQKLDLSAKSMKGKAVSHGTAYMPAKSIDVPNYCKHKPLVEGNGPAAVFNFLYRSKDALQQSLVIPCELPADTDEPDSNTKSAAKDGNACSTKVNPPSSPVRTFDELSEEEKERLAREWFEQKQRNKRVKREDETKPSKREFEGTSGSQRPAKRPAAYIDLTLD